MRTCRRRRPGMTLIELVVGLAATVILMSGLFTALFVTSNAFSPSMTTNAMNNAARALVDMTDELQMATTFSERTATAVTFTVSDRDGDAVDESIRYAWSGTGGSPLTRQYDGGPARQVVDSVTDLALEYGIATETPPAGATKYYVTSVRVQLQPITAGASRLYAAAAVANLPEVPTP